jgi:CheY-like chemotaxis protein
VRVSCDAGAGSDVVVFRVSDTGIGIPLHLQGQIFEPFRQGDGSVARRFGGSGLGLAISRQLVELMGGRIWLESEPGHGSTFSFSIRYEPVAHAAVPVSAAAQSRPAAAPLRLLVAEDNPVNQKLIRALLEADGHQIHLVDSGVGVVEALRHGLRFDAALLDIQMPEMDGFQAAAAVRACSDPVTRAVPIVALTANAQAGYEDLCKERGMDRYLPKPLDRTKLRGILGQIACATVVH